MAREAGKMITWADARYMVDSLGWKQKASFSGSNVCMTNSEFHSYVYGGSTSGDGYASNQLVPYDKLIKATLATSATSLSLADHTSYNYTLTVYSNTTWSVSSNAAWLTYSGHSTSGDDSFTVSISENTGSSDRTGVITITGGGISKTFTVTQPAQADSTISGVSVSSMGFYYDGQTSQYFDFDCDGDWTATTSVGWINIGKSGEFLDGSTSGGAGTNISIEVNCDENLTDYSRTGYIYLRNNAGVTQATITVSQEADPFAGGGFDDGLG